MKKEKTALPNLIIAGVNKAGTSSLFEALNAHPEFCGSSVKETEYFLPSVFRKQILPLTHYHNFFRHHQSEKIIFEATPGYFVGGKKTASLIHDTLPGVKILIVLRNPSKRLISFYRSKKLTFELNEGCTLSEYISLCSNCSEAELTLQENNFLTGIHYGYYMNYLPGWSAVFGKNIKVLFFENLVTNPSVVLKDICIWLNADPTYYDTFKFPERNKSFIYRNKLVHKLATIANKGAFLNRHPGFKSYIRKTYLSVNRKSSKAEISETQNREIDTLYNAHNNLLREFLIRNEINNLPSWLQS